MKTILLVGSYGGGFQAHGPYSSEDIAVTAGQGVDTSLRHHWEVMPLYPACPDPMDDTERDPEQLEQKYSPTGDGEHPDWPREDWISLVSRRETISGYWEWVRHQILLEEEEEWGVEGP